MTANNISQPCARCGQSIDIGRLNRLCTNCQVKERESRAINAPDLLSGSTVFTFLDEQLRLEQIAKGKYYVHGNGKQRVFTRAEFEKTFGMKLIEPLSAHVASR